MKKVITCLALLVLFSCDDVTEVEDISNKAVSILAPTNGSVITSTSINFSWNSIEDAEDYRLQIATPNFAEALQIVLDTTTLNTNFTKILEQGDYEWRIRAENSGFRTDYTTQSFVIE